MLKINFLGDSITEGALASDEKHSYVYLVGQMTNSMVRNYGVSVSGFTKRNIPNDDPRRKMYFASRVKDMDHDADYVFVFGGTNDFGRGAAPMGNINDNEPNTFYGGLNLLIHELLKHYKKEQIVFILPLHRDEEDLIIPDENDNPGHPLKDYCDVMTKVIYSYGIRLLDIREKFGKAKNNRLLADGLHPNDEGYRYLATLIADYINNVLLK